MEFVAGWRQVVVIVLLCATGVAEIGGDRRVRVFVYNDARVPASVLEQAGHEAVRIFRRAGIDLQWVNCSDRPARDECQAPADRDQLIVNVIPKGKSGSDSVYGDAFLAEDGSGRYADIFFDRIAGTHRESEVDEPHLLGAVAAHEIGHLLLGLRAHSLLGIMSPKWSSEYIKKVGMGTLLFRPEQASRMRQHANALALARGYASAQNYPTAFLP